MEKQERFDSFVQRLEEIKDEIGPSDFQFYNIAHFPIIYKNLLEHQDLCSTCCEKLASFEKIAGELPGNISGNPLERKKFESEKTQIEEHLKKSHNMHFPGYYTSLGSLLGIVIGGISVFMLNFFVFGEMFNRLTLIGFAAGIIVGRLIGALIDRNIFRRNLQL